jgi:2-haloacid dehalogenase
MSAQQKEYPVSQSNHAVRAIVFDFGGVLMDWNPRHLYRRILDDPEAVEHFLSEVGFDAWNMEQDRGRPFAEAVKLLSAQFPHRAELIQAYHLRWEESVAGAIEGSVAILEELRAAGHRLYGLSNWSAETFVLARRRYPFFAWFDAIVLSGEERVCKPDPAIYHALLERAGQPAGACLFIDDSATNIAAADALGFQTIRFESPAQLRANLVGRGLV